MNSNSNSIEISLNVFELKFRNLNLIQMLVNGIQCLQLNGTYFNFENFNSVFLPNWLLLVVC